MQIRCKECRYYQSRYADGLKTALCKKHSLANKKLQVTENFYCADAEKKHGLIEADKEEEDVAPVSNARWIVNKERTEMVCSHCHTRYKNMADEIEAFSTAFRGYYYCSYCGSKTEEIEYR